MNKSKRVLAIIGIILLLGSVLGICILLFFSNNFSDTIIRGLVSCLVAIPLVAYGYMLIMKYASRYKTQINNEKKEQ